MKWRDWLTVGLVTAVLGSMASPALAWRMEAGQATAQWVQGGAANAFAQATFQRPFDTPPLVFVLSTSAGSHSAALRVRNITRTGFEVGILEPPGWDGPHVAMDFHYLAIEPGRHRLPDGTVWEAGTLDTASVQRGPGVGGPSGWEPLTFQSGFSSPPVLLAEIQTQRNERNTPPATVSEPWLTVAVSSVTAGGARLALERSEVAGGRVDHPETIAWLAVQAGRSGSFTAADGGTVDYLSLVTGTVIRGWDDGCTAIPFSPPFPAPPLVLASLNTRHDQDGGWLRRCALTAGQVGLTIDEDTDHDDERSRRRGNSQNFDQEAAGTLAFSRPFHIDFGLVAHWRLDECHLEGIPDEVRDSGPYGLHGTPVGGTDTTPGRVCGAGKFVSGNNQYVRVPDADILDDTGALTVMAWVYPHSLGNAPRAIVSKRVTFGVQQSYSLFFYDGSRLHVDVDGNNNRLRTRESYSPGQWYHVAMAFDGGLPREERIKVWVNGVPQTLEPATGGGFETSTRIPNYGADLTIGELDVNRGAHFDGLIDDVRVYRRALTALEIAGLRDTVYYCAPCAALDHLEIVHDGTGLTCEPEPVTVRACANPDCSQLYANDVEVGLLPAGWVGGDTQIINTSRDVPLRHSVPETVTLGIAAANPRPLNPARCVGPAGAADCRLTFLDSGLVFDPPAAAPVACEPFTLDLRAVRTDDTTQTCVAGIADTTKPLRFTLAYTDPDTGTRPLTVAGVDLAGGGSATVPVAFDSQGRGRLRLAYADAGLLTLGAAYSGSGADAGLELSGETALAVRPHGLAMSATAGGAPLDNPTAVGAPRWPAGRGFGLTVRAVCADGSPTPNYRPGAAELAVELAAPDAAQGAVPGALTLGGQTIPGGFPGAAGWTGIDGLFRDGAVSDPGAAFSEVGTIRLQARDGDYFGAPIPPLVPVTVGRFAPDRFALGTADPGRLANACTGFTYLGQTFGYAAGARPAVTITPVNAAGAPVNNYREAFAKLHDPATQIDLAAAAATLGADGTTPLRLEHSPGTAALSPNGDGSLTLTLGDDRFRHLKEPNARIEPFPATLALSLTRVDDGDGTVAPAALTVAPAPVMIRFGRLLLDNAQGSVLAPLVLPLSAQYWDGGWRLNSLDGCTAYDGASLLLSTYTGNLAPGETHPDGAGRLLGGRHDPGAPPTLSAPGPGNDGSVTATLPAPAWLQDDADGDGAYDDAPRATATFGMPRGSERVIFRREVY